MKKLFQTLVNPKSSIKVQPWSAKLHYNVFYVTKKKQKKQKTFFNEIEYDKLYLSGSAPARIYGTSKMHKFSSSDSFPKLRPIVSSIGIFYYNLACFLCDLLSLLGPNDYSCKNNFFFVSQIKNADLSKIVLVSYDVTSLQETIDIAKNLIFNHNNNLSITTKRT